MMLQAVDDDEKGVRNVYTPDGVQKSWFLIGMNEMGTPLLY